MRDLQGGMTYGESRLDQQNFMIDQQFKNTLTNQYATYLSILASDSIHAAPLVAKFIADKALSRRTVN
ncbi:hypothetical protein SAMN06265368_3254 [Cohaesibacter gelatinilyticus]|uniref:Uncharacterized protein n=1 Tax=Cohaesibacter gelatinilyticus TaxID=372072 RepID=A0A285PJU5_9HYPH|nr:hypothetical protein SAMN06265368_3254 [Cohaesibacter gelatinilyticus]